MRQLSWRILPFFIFVLLAVFLWRGLSLDPRALPSVQLGKLLPDFNLPKLEDPHLRLTKDDFKNQVILLNVWASWCAACIEEQVFLMKLSREGVPIYGLNYKDDTQDAKRWLTQWGNPYRVVAQDKSGMTAIDLGVYGAPETFLIDKQGRIQYRHVGILTAEVWQKDLLPRMKNIEQVGDCDTKPSCLGLSTAAMDPAHKAREAGSRI